MDETPAPPACSLSPVDLVDRRADWAALADRIVSIDDGEARIRVRFRADADVVARLPALAAAERGCCGFAQWEVEPADGGDGAVVDLVVSGPPAALAGVRDAFADGDRAGGGAGG